MPTSDKLEKTPKKPVSENVRRYNSSPEHREHMRRCREKQKLMRGGPPKRTGVPNGWAGAANRKRLADVRKAAHEKAQTIMDQLIKDGIVQKDEAGNAALAAVVEVVIARDEDTGQYAHTLRDRMEAAKTVLTFTMPKPETKSTVKVESAESFLDAVLAKANGASAD